jgi:hypothetical protein
MNINYKEILFFIAKCLTINHDKQNKIIIENLLKSNTIDWESVVELSTAHLVYPSLYCNLRKACFLSYLPKDLVFHMKNITSLNRKRNKQIINQAKELNNLLLEHKITPVFIKGTGNLLEGLYEDIGERMVGDIDFIFSKEEYPRAIQLLKENGYSSIYNTDYIFPEYKHYPRLVKDGKISSIEIHKEILSEKYAHEFNYDFIINSCFIHDDIKVLSYENQLILSILSYQINDNGIHYKSFSLRNAYDIFLLSKKVVPRNLFNRFKKLYVPLNCYLASCFEVFNKPKTLQYNSSKEIKLHLTFFNKQLNNNKFRKKHYQKTKKLLFVKNRLTVILKSFFYNEYRVWLFRRITDKNWQKEQLIKLGIRKP